MVVIDVSGICYDVLNNLIWMVSNDWIDEFYNPGHQAWHHTLNRLGLDPEQKPLGTAGLYTTFIH